VRLTIVLFDERLRVRPAQAEIQRDRRRDLEVVLHEQRAPVVELGPGLRLAAASLAGDLVEQEIGEGESGKRASIAEQAEESVVSRISLAALLFHQLPAQLWGVPPFEQRQLLFDLIRRFGVVRVAGSSPNRCKPAAPAERAEARNRLPAGDAERRVRVSNPA